MILVEGGVAYGALVGLSRVFIISKNTEIMRRNMSGHKKRCFYLFQSLK